MPRRIRLPVRNRPHTYEAVDDCCSHTNMYVCMCYMLATLATSALLLLQLQALLYNSLPNTTLSAAGKHSPLATCNLQAACIMRFISATSHSAFATNTTYICISFQHTTTQPSHNPEQFRTILKAAMHFYQPHYMLARCATCRLPQLGPAHHASAACCSKRMLLFALFLGYINV